MGFALVLRLAEGIPLRETLRSRKDGRSPERFYSRGFGEHAPYAPGGAARQSCRVLGARARPPLYER